MKKEMRCYILPSTVMRVNADDIYSWMNAIELPDKAIQFIEEAENIGLVYSLRHVVLVFNDGLLRKDVLMFITDKY